MSGHGSIAARRLAPHLVGPQARLSAWNSRERKETASMKDKPAHEILAKLFQTIVKEAETNEKFANEMLGAF